MAVSVGLYCLWQSVLDCTACGSQCWTVLLVTVSVGLYYLWQSVLDCTACGGQCWTVLLVAVSVGLYCLWQSMLGLLQSPVGPLVAGSLTHLFVGLIQ